MIPVAPQRGFAASEFEDRTRKAQALMEAQGLSALLLMTEPEIRYFTGFQTLFWQSPTRPWFLFLPSSGKPVAVIPEIGAALMRQTWLDDVRTWSAPHPEDDGISLLSDLLSPLARGRETLGVMKGHETHLRMPLADWERLVALLPGLKIGDATGLVQDLRMVKSAVEIEKMRHICALGSAAFAAVPEIVAAGQPLTEVFRAFRREALRLGVDDVSYLVGGAGQGGYADVISPPTEKPIRDGDVLMLDTGCVWDGYFCDFDRNWAVRRADETAKRAYDVLWRATEAAIEAVQPGMTCRELLGVMTGVLDTFSDTGGDIGRMGHGLGMQLTEQPSLAAFDGTEIRENMVLTLEPSVPYGDGLMMVHEENIVVREGGAELLSVRAPETLPVL